MRHILFGHLYNYSVIFCYDGKNDEGCATYGIITGAIQLDNVGVIHSRQLAELQHKDKDMLVNVMGWWSF